MAKYDECIIAQCYTVLHSEFKRGKNTVKPNWVCSLCSMWSSRKFSVKRHIKTIHNDNASLVKYIDYHVGRQNGAYQPSTIPHKNSYNPEKEKKSNFEVFEDEYWKEKARLAARRDMGLI